MKGNKMNIETMSSEELYKLGKKREAEETIPKLQIQLGIYNDILLLTQKLLKNAIMYDNYPHDNGEKQFYHFVKNKIDEIKKDVERLSKIDGD